jgi:hypothetical protein
VVLRIMVSLALLAGCKQSLFDSHGDVDARGGGNGDGDVASSCPATCLADAAADFGMTKWRYLDDNKTRSWTEMAMMDGGFNGTGANRFSSCKNDSSASACDALPGALLVTTTDSAAAADPALSYTAVSNQVVQLTVRVHVPVSGTEQTVRVYRNAREDSLLTQAVTPGMTFERAFTLDAIKDDRFYLALSPTGQGAQQIGVHFYVNATGETFPMTCQVALQFSSPMATSTDNACGVDYNFFNNGAAANWALGTPAFPELGTSGDITMDKWFEGGDVIARAGDTTTQLWLRHDAFVSTYNALVFSDLDLDYTGGLGIYVISSTPPKLYVETCTLATQTELGFASGTAPYPDDHAWHFVRVVHTNGTVKICLDGKRVASYVLAAGKMQSMYHPWLARNLFWTPQGGFFDGAIDEVRVITGALPCD